MATFEEMEVEFMLATEDTHKKRNFSKNMIENRKIKNARLLEQNRYLYRDKQYEFKNRLKDASPTSSPNEYVVSDWDSSSYKSKKARR